mmetsp:Transcript_33017/g.71129  ORF Transcript_33017/g.71129 Transcript_33017/m.71129 type:complete len:169 (-) Transcript_33017:1375-1881(-)
MHTEFGCRPPILESRTFRTEEAEAETRLGGEAPRWLRRGGGSGGGSGSGSGSAGGTGLKHGLNSPGGSGLLNLSLGLAAATSGSTGLGILPRQIIPPKLPIVVQSFRWLQQMAFSSAGSLLPLQLDKDRRPKTTPESNSDSPLQALDLSFVTVVSRKVEELAHELQSL